MSDDGMVGGRYRMPHEVTKHLTIAEVTWHWRRGKNGQTLLGVGVDQWGPAFVSTLWMTKEDLQELLVALRIREQEQTARLNAAQLRAKRRWKALRARGGGGSTGGQ